MFDFAAFQVKMQAAGLSQACILRFGTALDRLRAGGSGLLGEADLEPVAELPRWEDLSSADPAVLRQAVVIKLNGGLGTSMGLRGPKSLLQVKPGWSFLRIAVEQQRRSGWQVPLLFMNSFHTSEATGKALEEIGFEQELPWEFLQSQVPKVLQADLSPAVWPQDPELEWCPPGHGEVYSALMESGAVSRLLAAGRRYAFLSNVDNTGATLDPAILSWMISQGHSLVMEVTRRTPMDRKGGHLAKSLSGGWVLREIAQCSPQDLGSFEDLERHRFFNTNNLWLDLEALHDSLELPLIVNRKTLDPRDPTSPPVFQLESAMGAAIGCIPRVQPLCVPRSRFAPVKGLADLLLVRSSAYALDEAAHLRLQTLDGRVPLVQLDSGWRTIEQIESAFPEPLDLMEARNLVVGPGVRALGPCRVWGDCEWPSPIHLPVGLAASGRLRAPAGSD